MKELSIEEKAKAYDEALERMRDFLKDWEDCGAVGAAMEKAKAVFQELKEPDDERIRKEIKNLIEEVGEDDSYHVYCFDEMIAWLEKQSEKTKPIEDFDTEFERQISHLIASIINKDYEYTETFVKWTSNALLNYAKHELEKQGEQKPSEYTSEQAGVLDKHIDKFLEQKPEDKVEPKFKVGNWYQCTKDFFGKGVTFDKNTAYYCAKEGCLQNEYGCHIAIVKDLYDNFKLWTIQDAKDGDVLATESFIFIFKNIDIDDDNGVHYYCHYEINKHENDEQFDIALPQSLMGRVGDRFTHYSPASKDQRDAIFAKMKEAGYEWNTEKNELKKIVQKPADKVEPKFKVGDWVVYDHRTYQIVELPQGRLINASLSRNGKTEKVPLPYCEKWSIQDAKDGDVLATEPIEGYHSPFVAIYKKQNEEDFDSYCFIGFDGKFYKGENGHSTEKVHPATKEQRDQLEKAMADAGYTFDFEKKKLKKVEQKPAWSEEDESMLNDIMHNIHFAETHRNVTGSSAMEKEQVNWLISIKDRVLPQPKQEWSEDDDDDAWLNDIINKAECNLQLNKDEINWLISLKDRVLLQPKQELDEEDENNILFLTSIIEECFKDKEKITLYGDTACANFTKEDVIDRLKSIRHQSHWKPSKEQIIALRWVLNNIPYNKHKEEISGLLDQIKEL